MAKQVSKFAFCSLALSLWSGLSVEAKHWSKRDIPSGDGFVIPLTMDTKGRYVTTIGMVWLSFLLRHLVIARLILCHNDYRVTTTMPGPSRNSRLCSQLHRPPLLLQGIVAQHVCPLLALLPCTFLFLDVHPPDCDPVSLCALCSFQVQCFHFDNGSQFE